MCGACARIFFFSLSLSSLFLLLHDIKTEFVDDISFHLRCAAAHCSWFLPFSFDDAIAFAFASLKRELNTHLLLTYLNTKMVIYHIIYECYIFIYYHHI